jgi:hypothetical protein
MTRRLFTYIVRHDTGLAPNPFWGACTLAVCTPNHQGSRVGCGDWITGFLPKARGHRLLYAVAVDEILSLNDFFHPQSTKAEGMNDTTWGKTVTTNGDFSWPPTGTSAGHQRGPT